MDSLQAILQRTSCREYTNQSVEQEKIDKLVQAINSSPTAYNYKDFRCIFITKQEDRTFLRQYANNQEHVQKAPLFVLFVADNTQVPKENKWAKADAIIACSLVMIAAEGLGLSSCLIGRIVNYQSEIKTRFAIPQACEVVLGITIGYAKNKGATKNKETRCFFDQYK